MRPETRSRIIGLGAALPDKVLTNAELEKIVDTTDEWIRTRTGISERRVVEKGTPTSHLAAAAAQQALDNAGISPAEVELIIVATITPDMLFPSTACLVQSRIGAVKATCFDVSAACSGFPYALSIADGMLRSGQYRNAVVIGAEVLSPFIDWTDRSTCVLFGDGAGAAVVIADTALERGITANYMGSDGSYSDILKIPAGGSACPPSEESLKNRLHTLKMAGSEVFKIAVRTMGDAIIEVSKRAGKDHSQIDCLIPHQANNRILQAVAERVEMPLEKVFINVNKYGNMSAASTPVALCEAVAQGKIKEGSNVVLVAFGGGLTWAANWIKW